MKREEAKVRKTSVTIQFTAGGLIIKNSKGELELTEAQAKTIAGAIQIQYRGNDGTN